MDAADLEQLKTLITEELERVAAHILKLEQRARPVSPDNAIGRLTRMEALGERGVQQTAMLAAKQRLQDLQEALARIDTDESFGLCEQCDEPIVFARLMLMPESRYCVNCLEKGE